jgi:hypothetical protein
MRETRGRTAQAVWPSLRKGTKMLRSIRKELSASLLAMSALVLPASAYAGGLYYTSPLWADNAQSYHACNVANHSTGDVQLIIYIYDWKGYAIAFSPGGENGFFLHPQQTYRLDDRSANYTGFAYCVFNLYIGSAGSIRANMSVFHNTGAYFETLALSEAR